MRNAVLLATLSLSACTVTSVVRVGELGTYVIPARPAPAAERAVAASNTATEDARKFCASMGARVVVIDAPQTADLRFRCEKWQQHAG